MKWLLLIFFFYFAFSASAKLNGIPDKKPTAFVPLFEQMQDMSPDESKNYRMELQKTIDQHPQKEISDLVVSSFPKSQKIPQSTEQSEDVFERVAWNKFALLVAFHCNKNPSPTCLKIFEIKPKK